MSMNKNFLKYCQKYISSVYEIVIYLGQVGLGLRTLEIEKNFLSLIKNIYR